jgi:hypothetical protein
MYWDFDISREYPLWQDLSMGTNSFDLVTITLVLDLLIENFNLGYIFWMVDTMNLTFHINIPCNKNYPWVPKNWLCDLDLGFWLTYYKLVMFVYSCLSNFSAIRRLSPLPVTGLQSLALIAFSSATPTATRDLGLHDVVQRTGTPSHSGVRTGDARITRSLRLRSNTAPGGRLIKKIINFNLG